MNKSVIGWIFALLVLFACIAVILVGGFFGYSMNADLSKAKADLDTANQTVTQKKADLDKANANLTKITSQLDDAKTAADDLQTSLDTIKSLLCSDGPSWSSIVASSNYEDTLTGKNNFIGQKFPIYSLNNELWIMSTNIALSAKSNCIVVDPSWKTIE
jgi:hypothetical protein